jgi:hypothetical protein
LKLGNLKQKHKTKKKKRTKEQDYMDQKNVKRGKTPGRLVSETSQASWDI